MTKPLQIIVGLFAAIGLAYVAMLAWVGISIHSASGCSGGNVMEVPSPTKAYLATVETDNCSSSHEQRTTVFLFAGNQGASVFIAPSAIQDAGSYSTMPLRLTWLADTELEIAYPRGVQLQSRAEPTMGVNIVYKTYTPYAP